MGSQEGYGPESAKSTRGRTTVMAARSTEASQVGISWSCGARIDRHPRESASATLAAKSGLSRSGMRKARADDQSNTGGGCKGECHSDDGLADSGGGWELSSHAPLVKLQSRAD